MYCRIGATRTNFLLETAKGDSMPFLEINEAEVQLGRHVLYRIVFVANLIYFWA